MSVACFPGRLSWCVHRESLLVSGDWDTGMSLGKKCWRRSSLRPISDRVRDERGTTADFPLQSWNEMGDWISGARGVVRVCLQPSCCHRMSCSEVSSGCLLDLWSLTKKSVGWEVRGDGVRDPQEMWAGVKEACSWCSVTVLGTRHRELREEMVCVMSTWFSGRYALRLSRGCLLEPGAGIQ